MAKAAMPLDEKQATRLWQIFIDPNTRGTLQLLAEIKARVKATEDNRRRITKLTRQFPGLR